MEDAVKRPPGDYRRVLSVGRAVDFAGSARVGLGQRAAIIGGSASVIEPGDTRRGSGGERLAVKEGLVAFLKHCEGCIVIENAHVRG